MRNAAIGYEPAAPSATRSPSLPSSAQVGGAAETVTSALPLFAEKLTQQQKSMLPAMTGIAQYQATNPASAAKRKFLVFAVIVMTHILLIWALQYGLFNQLTRALPTELFVTMIPADMPASLPKPVLPKPAHKAPPKLVQVVQHSEPVVPTVTASPISPVTQIETPSASSVEIAAPAQATSAAPQVTPPIKTISSGVEYLRPPKPVYPTVSRRLREQGKAVIRVLVNERGMPELAEIQHSSGSAQLDEAARQAVLNALFKPLIENGQAVAVYALIPIRFQLDG